MRYTWQDSSVCLLLLASAIVMPVDVVTGFGRQASRLQARNVAEQKKPNDQYICFTPLVQESKPPLAPLPRDDAFAKSFSYAYEKSCEDNYFKNDPANPAAKVPGLVRAIGRPTNSDWIARWGPSQQDDHSSRDGQGHERFPRCDEVEDTFKHLIQNCEYGGVMENHFWVGPKPGKWYRAGIAVVLHPDQRGQPCSNGSLTFDHALFFQTRLALMVTDIKFGGGYKVADAIRMQQQHC